MKKILLITRYHVRKWKAQTVAVALLMFVAATMCNLWLMLSMDYKQNFERSHQSMQAEDVTFVAASTTSSFQNFLQDFVDKDPRTDSYALDDVLYAPGSFPFQGGEIVISGVVLMEKDLGLSRAVGKVEIVEEGSMSNGIYLPMIYRGAGGYEIGDTFELHINDKILRFPVCGFINSLMTGSHNCVLATMLLSEDQYVAVKNQGVLMESTIASITLQDQQESPDYEAELKGAIASQFPQLFCLSNHYQMVYNSRYISQMICSGIISAMAIFIIIIALVVIFSNIINHIQEDMKNLGALKAIGYRSSQIIHVLQYQFMFLTFICALLGIITSYGLFPWINELMITQTGIPYQMHFLPIPCMITIVSLCVIVYLVVWLSARRIKAIDPILALRQGMKTHSFRRNHVPLAKTRCSLTSALAYKNICSNHKQNIILSITTMVLMLIITFNGVMFRNVISDIEPFIQLIVGESTDSSINVDQTREEEFQHYLDEQPQVERYYLFTSENVRHQGGVELYATMSDDFAKLNNQNLVINGRFPKYDNEIAIGIKYAEENDLAIGDQITLTAKQNTADYLITGFTQTSNNLGKDCLLTRNGYERLGNMTLVSYYINMDEDADIDAFHEQVKQRFGSDLHIMVNVRKTIEANVSVYVNIMTMIVFATFALSLIVITIVLYLMVKTFLNHKRHAYGILKSLGFTSHQLMIQTIKSFLSIVAISAMLGFFLSVSIINPLLAIFLRDIGLLICKFIIPFDFLVIFGILFLLYIFMMVYFLSRKIKKITVVSLLKRE